MAQGESAYVVSFLDPVPAQSHLDFDLMLCAQEPGRQVARRLPVIAARLAAAASCEIAGRRAAGVAQLGHDRCGNQHDVLQTPRAEVEADRRCGRCQAHRGIPAQVQDAGAVEPLTL
jgi:hypothetical protein